jgi:hypothetical protein
MKYLRNGAIQAGPVLSRVKQLIAKRSPAAQFFRDKIVTTPPIAHLDAEIPIDDSEKIGNLMKKPAVEQPGIHGKYPIGRRRFSRKVSNPVMNPRSNGETGKRPSH